MRVFGCKQFMSYPTPPGEIIPSCMSNAATPPIGNPYPSWASGITYACFIIPFSFWNGAGTGLIASSTFTFAPSFFAAALATGFFGLDLGACIVLGCSLAAGFTGAFTGGTILIDIPGIAGLCGSNPTGGTGGDASQGNYNGGAGGSPCNPGGEGGEGSGVSGGNLGEPGTTMDGNAIGGLAGAAVSGNSLVTWTLAGDIRGDLE